MPIDFNWSTLDNEIGDLETQTEIASQECQLAIKKLRRSVKRHSGLVERWNEELATWKIKEPLQQADEMNRLFSGNRSNLARLRSELKLAQSSLWRAQVLERWRQTNLAYRRFLGRYWRW